MILSQDLDYLFGEGHRRYVVVSGSGELDNDSTWKDEAQYSDDLEYAEKHYNKVIEKDETSCASLAVVIDDTDGDPFSNGSGYVSLLEAVADVTQIATGKEYYSGDSRQDIQMFIHWAIEFEKLHLGVAWGVDEKMPSGKAFPYHAEYMDAIEKFTEEKIFIHMKEDQ